MLIPTENDENKYLNAYVNVYLFMLLLIILAVESRGEDPKSALWQA